MFNREHKEKLYNSIIDMINNFTRNIKSKAEINEQLDSLQFNNKPKSEKPLCFKGEDIDF
ncbi:hypothetical protein PIROE2DRAFT_17215 [Piromyces sp. E2]|nr:hypothetical protein PIROE2DRAFT_17215 [Piromyces sp. E2]|eukprot:OUM57711.1 hypothetical protein PIROE2DRAFT_17215 [Piromyces sp. E2]